MNKNEYIEWEIEQIKNAIVYYDNKLQDCLYVKQEKEIMKNISKLKNRLYELEGQLSGHY